MFSDSASTKGHSTRIQNADQTIELNLQTYELKFQEASVSKLDANLRSEQVVVQVRTR